MKKVMGLISGKVANYKHHKMHKKADKIHLQADAFIRKGESEQARMLIKKANEIREKANIQCGI